MRIFAHGRRHVLARCGPYDVRYQNIAFLPYANMEYLDQPLYSQCLALALPFLKADIKDTDHVARICKLVWDVAVRGLLKTL